MNKTTNVIWILAILFFVSCKKEVTLDYVAGEYYKNIYLADSLFIVKEYEKSYTVFEKVFSEFQPINTKVCQEVATYIKLKIILDKEVSYSEYADLITKYGYPEKYLKKDSILSLYYKKVKDKFDNEAPVLRKTYLSSLNMDLRDQLIEMRRLDQLYRQGNYYKENIKKQDTIDATNATALMEIFDTYGFPSEKIIGDYSIDNQFININAILLHTKDSIRKHYFIPKVLEYVKQGKANPRFVGIMEDQLLIYAGKEQYYGTYKTKKEMTATLKELNERRASIGLPNYGYQDWRAKKLYP